VAGRGARLFAVLLPLAAGWAGCGPDETAAPDPQWIWRDHDLRHVEAVAFYAVRDVEVDRIEGTARLRVQADEEYVLTINGSRIGSGRRGFEAEGDEYDVTPWLSPGWNRVVALLRSSNGAGGFWLELADDRGLLARSDGDWTIYRGEWRGIYRRGALLPGDRPMVLGPSPLGRWRTADRFVRREAFQRVLATPEPVTAVAFRKWGSGEEWTPIREQRRRPPSFGPLVEIDFGEVRTGYLQLAFRDSALAPELPSLLFFSTGPLEAPPLPADLTTRPIPGRNLFQDAIPRRFRYVAVAGMPGLFQAHVLPIRPEAYDGLAPREGDVRERHGVFGIDPPPPLRSPVENEVWRELERTAGIAVRKPR